MLIEFWLGKFFKSGFLEDHGYNRYKVHIQIKLQTGWKVDGRYRTAPVHSILVTE
jgi:hypothetical protein